MGYFVICNAGYDISYAFLHRKEKGSLRFSYYEDNINTGGKRVSEIGEFKVNDITKIDFQYNSGAIKAGSIENKGKVNEFMNYLNSCSLKKKSIQLQVSGYYQLLVLHTENKEVMRIMTYDKFIEINGIQYNMVKSKLNLEKIDDLIKSLK